MVVQMGVELVSLIRMSIEIVPQCKSYLEWGINTIEFKSLLFDSSPYTCIVVEAW